MAKVFLLQTPGRNRSGVFVCVLLALGLLSGDSRASAQCPAEGPVQWVEVAKVVDGDSLRLLDGRKLRLIAVNAPELYMDGKSQPLSRESRQAVVNFFTGSKRIAIQQGLDGKDRYGRMLAHVYREDGLGLAEHLLAQGLAWQVVVPPNARYHTCLHKVEQQARSQRAGVWRGKHYPLLDAEKLSLADTGFQRIRGRVGQVSRSQQGWWIHMGNLAIKLQRSDLRYFPGIQPEQWLQQTLVIRGWVIDRSKSAAGKRYSPLMMQLRHPAMME